MGSDVNWQLHNYQPGVPESQSFQNGPSSLKNVVLIILQKSINVHNAANHHSSHMTDGVSTFQMQNRV